MDNKSAILSCLNFLVGIGLWAGAGLGGVGEARCSRGGVGGWVGVR